MVKGSIKLGLKQFGSMRMVHDYANQFYLPATKEYNTLIDDSASKARQHAERRAFLKASWSDIHIEPPVQPDRAFYRVGDDIELSTVVHLGRLSPEDVVVQIYYGQLKTVDAVMASMVSPMAQQEDLGDRRYRYGCTIKSTGSGHYGFTARVVPSGDHWCANTPGLITWAQSESRHQG